MKILYYNCFAGISGDMNMAALIDLGVDFEALKKELSKLNLAGYHLEKSCANRNNIFGTKIDVVLEDPHAHPHRKLKDIKDIIEASTLSQRVSNLALKMFETIAKAEAKIHGTTIDKVHFHEVGAVDSIVDVVGAAICLELINVDKVMAGPVELGSGFIKCAHGTIPVPAPATLEILKGVKTTIGNVEHEATTPTGAAIIKACVEEYNAQPELEIEAIGYGIGQRQTEKPNVLRVIIGNVEEITEQEMLELECSIDDMNPEFYDNVLENLLKAGANDAFITPIMMKKNRPAHNLTVICAAELEAQLSRIILTETTTLGIRKHPISRQMLKRKIDTVDSCYGKIRVKRCYLDGKLLRTKAEYEDCKVAAQKHQVSLLKVYQEINKICQ